MENKNIYKFDDFIRCKSIWFLFLTELNWNRDAINPLEIIPESFWPGITELLIQERFIGQTNEYYLSESDKYMEFLSKGGKPFHSVISEKV
tara:strand:+ start:504 stop:776 length:273 start_codon:yes stop_codon:yes gene_type:complete